MPIVNASISDFTGAYAHLNGNTTVQLSRRKCLKFATTVGLSNLRPAHPNGVVALALASYRAMAVKCCLDFSGHNVAVHGDFRSLETSEKANINYWIGMTGAAVAADSYLQVSRLVHATQFNGAAIQRANTTSKSLADLIGVDLNGGYHVIEAKGRGRGPTANERNAWKTQAQTIGMIGGAQPVTRSYCVAVINSQFRIDWNDPPEPPSWTLNLSSNEDAFDEGYYGPFRTFLDSDTSQKVERDGRDLLVRVIAFDPQEHEYVYLGLLSSFLQTASSRQLAEIQELDAEDTYVGRDGVAVITGKTPCELI